MIFREDLGKTLRNLRIDSVPAELQTRQFPKASEKSFLFESVFNILFCDNFNDQEINFVIGQVWSVRLVSVDIVN